MLERAHRSKRQRQGPSVTSLPIQHTVLERFLRYVVIDTQSDPSSPTCPSTEKQKDLGRLLVTELKAMGISDANLDEHGYVYATIPANTDKKVPVICFCSRSEERRVGKEVRSGRTATDKKNNI